MRRRIALAILSSGLMLTACDTRAREWTAWVYPDARNLTVSIGMSGFQTFEQCQTAAIGQLRQLPNPDGGDYECGYMCRWEPTVQTNVCRETRK